MNPLQVAVQFFLYPLEVFFALLFNTNTLTFYYVVLTLAVVYRLLIAPIIGIKLHDAASDMARPRKNRSGSNKQARRSK